MAGGGARHSGMNARILASDGWRRRSTPRRPQSPSLTAHAEVLLTQKHTFIPFPHRQLGVQGSVARHQFPKPFVRFPS
jgi:hypothetical protein